MKKTNQNRFLNAFLVVILTAATLFANDGVFYVRGNNLIPLQETQVELQKEILKFYVTDFGWMKVDIDFTFYNPGATKELTVGFVTPPGDGDIDEESAKHPQIKDFTVNVDGKVIPFQIKQMENTSFSYGKLGLAGVDFVYHFKARFKTGTTRIRHTYTFRGGSSVELQRDFEYQITTGKRWANKQIDDFEMQVHLDNGIYGIPATFYKDKRLAKWEIVGHGALSQGAQRWFDGDTPEVRMAHLNRGFLRFKEKDFRPDSDIMFAEYNWAAGWVSRWCDFAAECFDRKTLEKVVPYFNLNPWEGTGKKELSKLNAHELRIVRNYFYAVRGYEFKTEEVKTFYSQFFWFQPDRTLKWDELKLSKAEKVFVEKVVAAEKEKTDY